MTFTIGQQIDIVRREIAKRREVYGRLVSRGTMRQSIADYEIAGMQAVLATLKLAEEAMAAKAALDRERKARR